MLKLFSRDKGAMADAQSLTQAESDFIDNTAFPLLDATKDEKSLEKLAEALWNLCLWERQRTTALDAKAASLTGLASLAATAVSVASTLDGTTPAFSVLVARTISIGLFIAAVILSLNAQRVVHLGGFFDEDVFEALGAYKEPVGTTPFQDADPYRCFLRETALQRWVIFRNHSDANDRKFRRLGVAQVASGLAVLSLLGVLITAMR